MNVTKKQENIVMVCTFIVFYCSVGFFCKNTLPESVNTIVSLIAIVWMIYSTTRRVVVSKELVTYVMLLLILGGLSSMLAGDEMKFVLYPIVNLILAVLYTSAVPLQLFKKIFIKIVYLVSCISIICGIIYWIIPSFFSIFPIIINTAGNGVRNLFLTVIPISGSFRLQGFTWEAGVFQLFINLALTFLTLGDWEEKDRKRKTLVLFIALLFTFSTTGYILGLINIFILISKNYDGSISGIGKILLTLIGLCIILFIVLPMLPTSISGVSFGMAKIQRFLQGVSTADSMDSSSVRFDSVYYPIKQFIAHPILGGGYSGLNSIASSMRHSMLTCTIVNYFAMYGIFYGCLIVKLMHILAKRITRYKIFIILIVIELILGTFSEQFVNYLFIDILLLIGFSLSEECKESD